MSEGLRWPSDTGHRAGEGARPGRSGGSGILCEVAFLRRVAPRTRPVRCHARAEPFGAGQRHQKGITSMNSTCYDSMTLRPSSRSQDRRLPVSESATAICAGTFVASRSGVAGLERLPGGCRGGVRALAIAELAVAHRVIRSRLRSRPELQRISITEYLRNAFPASRRDWTD